MGLSMTDIVVIDYGHGNLKSIQRGFEKVGKRVLLSSDPSIISNADRLILPGVGAFGSGMRHLEGLGLTDALNDFVKKGNPLLGICLGMQMLFDSGKENGMHKGLGLIPGIIDKISDKTKSKKKRKVPHIGWSALINTGCNSNWKDSCLTNLNQGDYVYFVHSYMAILEGNEYLLSQCNDEGLLIPAAVKRDNITGLQFHPEKSGKIGLRILSNFSNL
jgi:glutamine amidotransferase